MSIQYTHAPAFVVVVVQSQCSNIFSSETAWAIKAKFHVEPPWEGGTKVYINLNLNLNLNSLLVKRQIDNPSPFCSNGPGHMTKMAAQPIYGKNL